MFADAREVPEGEVLTADICIAGAGAAGIAIARDLIPSGLRVVVLESGGLEQDSEVQALYEGVETGLPYGRLSSCRVRFFGGSTNAWSGWCRPLEPETFAERPGIAPGWPIDFEDLEPHYRRANATCGIGAFEFEPAALAAREERELLSLDPARVQQVLYQYSQPLRFGRVYRSELESAADVAVYLHANLENIALAEAGGGVRAFEVATLGGRRFEVRADQYVLALGGIENARMMLASRSQEAAGVGNGNDLVGRFFMEHPHSFYSAAIVARAGLDLSFYFERYPARTIDDEHPDGIETRVTPALALPAQVREAEGIVPMSCELRPLEQGLAGPFAKDEIGGVARLAEGGLATYGMHFRGEQRPIRASRVTLTSDNDPLGIPRPELHWQIDDRDRADYRRSLELVGAELARAGVGRLWIRLDDDGLPPLDEIAGGCHHMGTTRMSEDPAEGVVDGDCRVHGLDNLYVAGSSVFPSTGYANPTLTIVALAHRLADHLAEAAS